MDCRYLWHQVSKHNLSRVQVRECVDNVDDIEFDVRFWQYSPSDQMIEQVPCVPQHDEHVPTKRDAAPDKERENHGENQHEILSSFDFNTTSSIMQSDMRVWVSARARRGGSGRGPAAAAEPTQLSSIEYMK